MIKNKNCKIILLDEVNCILVGLHPDHIIYFYEKYGEFAKGHFFNPLFTLGTWDGKIRFFHKTGKTYINLLKDIIPRVKKLGYKIELEDNRNSYIVEPELITEDYFSNVKDPETGEPWKVRDYQVEGVNGLITNGGGILIVGTGGGKSSMAAALALSYERAGNLRSIIIVPDRTLNDQTREEYELFGLDVGEYSGKSKDLKHQHVVATWQTLKNNPTVISTFQVIINDEAHGVRGQILQELLLDYGKNIQYRFGCTGTLPTEPADLLSVKIALGDVQYEVPAHKLITEGHLAKVEIDIIQMKVDLREEYNDFLKVTKDDPDVPYLTYTSFKNSYFPDFTSEKKFLHSEKSRQEWIAKYLENFKLLNKGNTLVLVSNINFGKKLASLIPNSVFLHGKDDVKVRKEIYESFKHENNLIVFATINIAGTGLNIRRIFNLILIDLGKSFIRTIQSIGRGLRKTHDKDSVYVADICSDLKYSRRHMSERIKYYEEAKYPNKKRTIDY